MSNDESKWTDRLLYTEELPVPHLLPLFHPDNPKIHPQGQTEALKGAIRTLGWMARPKINVRSSEEWGELADTPVVIDGHDRIKAASEAEQESLNCDFYDLTPNEEKLFLLTYDPIGMMAIHDRTAVETLMNQVNTDDELLQQVLTDFAEENHIIVGGEDVDHDEHWQNMPEFDQDDVSAKFSIKVNFYTEEDMMAFAELVDQPVTDKTISINFPYVERMDLKSYES